jgi:hypothetical protein
METLLYIPLVCRTYNFESKRHYCIIESTKCSDDGCLNFIFDFEGNLVIPQIAV